MSPMRFNHSIIKKPVEHTKDPNKFHENVLCWVELSSHRAFGQTLSDPMFRAIDSVLIENIRLNYWRSSVGCCTIRITMHNGHRFYHRPQSSVVFFFRSLASVCPPFRFINIASSLLIYIFFWKYSCIKSINNMNGCGYHNSMLMYPTK